MAAVRGCLHLSGYYLPYGLGSRGRDARISRPRMIRGADRIHIGESSFIHKNSQLQAIERVGEQNFQPRIMIGSHVYIGQNVFIACINEITIEDRCVLSDDIYISDSSHGLDPVKGPIMEQSWESRGPIKIGFSTFIGFRAIIMPGVVLGRHCVVGAGAVVTRSFPEYSMVGGAPARLLKTFSQTQKRWVPASKADDDV
jgi:acetyltransferase-like isoleucine patch superfamily enzyme